jgi:hypothetical protein
MDDFDDMARSVLGFYGYEGGVQPGGFVTALIKAWEKADLSNRARLAQAFPVLGDVIAIFQVEDGPKMLLQMIGARSAIAQAHKLADEYSKGVKNDA